MADDERRLPKRPSPRVHLHYLRKMSCSTALRLQPVFLTTRLFRPRAALVLPSHVLLRHASSSKAHITEKPRILEQPARFNPPSHASHAPRRARPRAYGAPLSDAERDAQAEKRYPNMMPPEGSFMHRVLTNRTLHLWITLVCRLPARASSFYSTKASTNHRVSS